MRVTYITTNILIILQNIFAADGALYILWSTADIKDVKIRRNPLYCKVTFHLQCIPFRLSVFVAGLLLNIQHKYMKNMAGTSNRIIFYLYFTSKEIKSSLKINYVPKQPLCSSLFECFTKYIFSRRLISNDHNNRVQKKSIT